jgi:phospholipid N-methyltransferase
MSLKSVARDFVPPILMRALRPTANSGVYTSAADSVYTSAGDTIAAAQAAGLSVGDYVERLWGIQGRSALIVERLHQLGTISAAQTVVEIGAGTGRYTGHTLKYCAPKRYQIYETDNGWASWLVRTYPVEVCPADGRSLASTESQSVDLMQSFGTFVYLPFMISYRYFKEMARVAAPRAFITFDIISERCLEAKTVDKWIESGHDFPCFLSVAYVRQFFEENGFRLLDSFVTPYDVGSSEYLVFRRP